MNLRFVHQHLRWSTLQRYIAWFVLVIFVVLMIVARPTVAQDASSDADFPAWAQAPATVSQPDLDPDLASDLDDTNLVEPVLVDQPAGNRIDGFPVVLNNEVLFRIKEGVAGVATAEERAGIIQGRINAIATNPAVSLDQIHVNTQNNRTVIKAGDQVLFTVTEADAQVGGQSINQLANQAVESIQTEVAAYRAERSVKRRTLGIVLTVVSTLILLIFLRSLFLLSSKLLLRVAQARHHRSLGLQIHNFQILGASATGYLLAVLIRLGRLVLVLVAFYLYIPFVLRQFPATRPLGDRVLNDLAGRLNNFAQAFVTYLPNLVTIVVIGIVAYYVFGFVKQVIAELGRTDVYPWFYPEWIQPTNRLAGFLVFAIACVIAGPYLPGFGSPAFQGVSIFLGALLTLGSSSAVANAISGIILIYTRAFQIGDFIRIDTNMGEVTEKSLFVTRIMTPKRETITIPNLSVLNSNVVNYTAICRESGGYLTLHTTVTLGYDVPWRKVYEVMTAAATATKYITAEPAPFVLQTALNDFNVSYELNAYTNRPELMPRIYSELHANLQDYCNSADIEILSPAFSALRDGNHSTLPADYLPEDYRAPMFQIRQDS